MPFPLEWHDESDNADCLDVDTMHDLALTFRVVVAEFLGLNEYID